MRTFVFMYTFVMAGVLLFFYLTPILGDAKLDFLQLF